MELFDVEWEDLGKKKKILSIDPGKTSCGILIYDKTTKDVCFTEIIRVEKPEIDLKEYLDNILTVHSLDLIIIEKQFGNEDLIRIEQFLISYFILKNFPVIRLNSLLKYSVFDIKGCNRKKQLIVKMESMANDIITSLIRNYKRRMVHLLDCLSQIFALDIIEERHRGLKGS